MNDLSTGGPGRAGTDTEQTKTALRRSAESSPVVITGGAGFVGANLAHRLLSDGRRVTIYDNLSRPGVRLNVDWLRQAHGDLLQVEIGDVRDAAHVARTIRPASQVFHFAAQVAVTTSLTDPVEDFEINARGTLNVLEAIRACASPPGLVFTSTNKVYGGLDDVALRERNERYEPEDVHVRDAGISEARPLDFHSPYGCSKGAADQYVIDYARTFDLPAVVFRMSCVYGPRQFGTEDQGWVAHFIIRALEGEPITIYGDGKQVRDVLFVDDLVRAFLKAQQEMDRIRGAAFNIGGGPGNTISLLNLLDFIAEMHGARPDVRFDAWRPGDQRYYVSDTRAFQDATGWAPQVDAYRGIEKLSQWLSESRAVRRETRADSVAEVTR